MNQKQLIDTLNDLIETCKDGELGFDTCAANAESHVVREVFVARGRDCRDAADELQALVVAHGGQPEDRGSAKGAVERGWTSLLGTVGGRSDKRMLEAAERGEDHALATYREAVGTDLPPDVRAVVERQMQGLYRNHAQIRTLRDQARAVA